MAFMSKKIGLFVISCTFVMLLIMSAGCAGQSPVEETTPVEGGAPTAEATQAATVAGAAEQTTGTDVTGAAAEQTNSTGVTAGAAASGTVYNVTGANVTLIDQTNGQSGISGIAAAANTRVRLWRQLTTFVGSELTVGKDTLPVYAGVDISKFEGRLRGPCSSYL
jgi:hypothetical protein